MTVTKAEEFCFVCTIIVPPLFKDYERMVIQIIATNQHINMGWRNRHRDTKRMKKVSPIEALDYIF